jgi:hypothetical protein
VPERERGDIYLNADTTSGFGNVWRTAEDAHRRVTDQAR